MGYFSKRLNTKLKISPALGKLGEMQGAGGSQKPGSIQNGSFCYRTAISQACSSPVLSSATADSFLQHPDDNQLVSKGPNAPCPHARSGQKTPPRWRRGTSRERQRNRKPQPRFTQHQARENQAH